MKLKTKSMLGLLIFLIGIIIINPVAINNLYNNILGRTLIIVLLVYVSMNNKIIGLLVILLIIGCLNLYTYEGFENNSEDKKIKVLTNDSSKEMNSEKLKEKIQEKKDELNEKGVDKETIKTSIQSLDSNTIPINKDDFKNKATEVDASEPKGKLSENFCSSCSSCSYVM